MTQSDGETHTFVPLDLKSRGRARPGLATQTPQPDPTLLKGLARACYWQSLLDTGQAHSLADIVRAESLDQADVTRWMRLTLLAPDLIEQLLAGQQPVWLTWRWLKQHRLPDDWAAQRRLFNPELEKADHAPEVLR
jgi:hypothetical protein